MSDDELQRDALPKGTVLANEYEIEGVLGRGGFAFTYKAFNRSLARPVAIKEYFLSGVASRDEATLNVFPSSDKYRARFTEYLEKFHYEARVLAALKADRPNPHIVSVERIFEQFNTFYIVLEFIQGQTLEAWLESLGRPPQQAELDELVIPILGALHDCHQSGIFHRDLKPENIYIRGSDYRQPVLIDFGSARQIVETTLRQRPASAPIVSTGYSPLEAYSSQLESQGAWTDIYGLAATLYRAVSGEPPPDAFSRHSKDICTPATQLPHARYYRPEFLAAIDRGLAVRSEERPQTVPEWRQTICPPAPQTAPPSVFERGAPTTMPPVGSRSTDHAQVRGPSGSNPQSQWPSQQPGSHPRASRSAPNAASQTPPPAQRGKSGAIFAVVTSLAALGGLGVAGAAYLDLISLSPDVERPAAPTKPGREAEEKRRAEREAAAKAEAARKRERDFQERLKAEADRNRELQEKLAAEAAARKKAEEVALKRKLAAEAAARRRAEQKALDEKLAAEAAAKRRAEQRQLEAKLAAEAAARKKAVKEALERKLAAEAEAKKREEARIALEKRLAEEDRKKRAAEKRKLEEKLAAEAKAKKEAADRALARKLAAEAKARQEAEQRELAAKLAAEAAARRRAQEAAARQQAALRPPKNKPSLAKSDEDILFVAFSQSGEQAAVLPSDGAPLIWRPFNGSSVRLSSAGSTAVEAIAFQRNGGAGFAMARRNEPLTLWPGADKPPVAIDGNRESKKRTFALAYSQDEKSLIALNRWRRVKKTKKPPRAAIEVWSTGGQKLRTISEVEAEIRSAEFSPDGRFLAIAMKDGKLVLRDRTRDYAKIGEVPAPKRSTPLIAFSSDSKRLAVSSTDKAVKIYDLSNARLNSIGTVTGSVTSLTLSPQQADLVAYTIGNTAYLRRVGGSGPKQFSSTGDYPWIRFFPRRGSEYWLAYGRLDGKAEFLDAGKCIEAPGKTCKP